MRVLHLVHQYLPDHVGGTELYTRWLTRELSARGHPIAIFHRRSAEGVGRDRRDDEGVTVWAAWHGAFQPTDRFLSTFRNRPLQAAFAQTLDEFGPDLVHVEHLMGLPAALLDVLQNRAIPYVVTLWDFWWVCANAQLITNDTGELCAGPDGFRNCARCVVARSPNLAYRMAGPALRWPLARRNQRLRAGLAGAAALIAPAPFVQQWYMDHDLPVANMTVAPPGLDYPSRPYEERGPRPFRIGYVGGLSVQKGVHTLVEAFAALTSSGATSELWIAGDPTFDPAYADQLRELAGTAADGSVHFLGKLGRDEVWAMLAQVDVVVVPSIWYETFCFVVSEAFAMGAPVITTDLGVLADRVRHGVDGFLYPPGDVDALAAQLRECRDDPALLPRLRANIRPGLTVAQHADQIEAIYRRALA